MSLALSMKRWNAGGIGTALLAGLTVMATAAVEATSARANDLLVRYDQSTLLRLPRPVAEVIVGNPSIADVAVQGNNMLVVTGKTFGVTNVIVLDSDRNVIQDQRIVVQRDDPRVVNLHRGTQRTSYSCAPYCNVTLTIGDEVKHFEDLHRNSEKKVKFSDGTAEGASQGGQ